MNSEIKILELSDRDFSALVPLVEKKKADRILRYVETYLVVIGDEGFHSSWSEIKKDDSWFTEFSFKFREPKPGLKKAIEFSSNQALKEGEMAEV